VEYIFCSNDKCFGEEVVEEFAKVTGNILHIVSTPEGIKEKLDELIPLGLHLEERNERAREFIMSKIGTITNEVNKAFFFQNRNNFGAGLPLAYEVVTSRFLGPYSTSSIRADDIAGFDYQSIELLNFESAEGGSDYRVDASLVVNVVYKDKTNQRSLYESDSFPELSADTYFNLSQRPLNAVAFVNEGMSITDHKPYSKVFNTNILCNPETGTFLVESVH
jgi:hypothetical protein